MVTFPNAKVNIGLDVLRRRPDGYHDISTVMIPVPWSDILEIVPGTTCDDTLSVSGRHVDCPPEKNLVIKAVKALREHCAFPPVDIFLNKIIPDGAGLGGGSSDAAFTLVALNELFRLGLSKDRLAEIASVLGADCPFFIYNRPMLCEGTGTTLSPYALNLPDNLSVVIVKPAGVSVSTKEAYAGISPAVPERDLPELLSSLPLDQWQKHIKNDFERSVFPICPVIGDIKERIMGMGAIYASMSGSGSSVYGFFEGDIMTDKVAAMFPGCDTLVSKLSLAKS